VATPAFAVNHDTPPDGRFGANWLAWTPYSYPFNLTLQPAASLPCGLTGAGLPVGLQVVGPVPARRPGAAGVARLREHPALAPAARASG
jgi:aspartyl-tRNA(Asn)/glutamyl-tRNA(Gln) amidotransferase subunit A